MASDWQVNSWQRHTPKHKIIQQPSYDDEQKLAEVLHRLAASPPLVRVRDILALRHKLRQVAAGNAFILQAGDCAEMFSDCKADIVQAKITMLAEMAARLAGQAGRQAGERQKTTWEVIQIGRIAGQYAKPRSDLTITNQGQTLPNYFGDAVNGYTFTADSRRPNPSNLVDAYEHATKTLAFMHEHPQVFTSHECLLLAYEQTQVRKLDARYFNCSAHMQWIGARSCAVDSAHVELLRGVDNAIGVKVSAQLTPEELVAIIQRLNPDNAVGKIILIMRLGKDYVVSKLPQLIDACLAKSLQVLWMVDPMHGNTKQMSDIKTRDYDDICAELETSFKVHSELGSYLAGVHLEVASSAVTECIGGGVRATDLPRRYETACDPRLNREQSLELAGFIASLIASYQRS